MPVPTTIAARTEFVLNGVRHTVTTTSKTEIRYVSTMGTPYRTTRQAFDSLVSAGVILLVG